MPMNPRAAVPVAKAAGWPARSTSIVPSRNAVSFTTAYDAAFGASAAAMTWIALRPLKVVCAIDTFLPVSRSGLWAASGTASSADRDARITIIAEGLWMCMSPPAGQHEPEQHTAAGHYHVLTAVEFVSYWRVTDGADRCMPQGRAVGRSQRKCISAVVACESESRRCREHAGWRRAVAEFVAPADPPRPIIYR